ncbi:MAG: 3-hydroxybutyrate dehydrogenase [Deltaproteobacteria bacterium]|nr:3-hydroxybutyrate dehydrogenase [Deltaproteobacteria bacterium]
MELAGKVALVTGAGSGIGKAIAEVFGREGIHVLVNDVDPSGREVAERVGGTFLPADLADPQAVKALALKALDARGRVDLLVNNAGFQHVSPVESFPEEIWAKMIQVMLTAPFQLIKYLIPGMKERGWGRVINVASLHGVVASPFKAAYISAKHGMLGLTKTVALEVAEHGVTVNAICPAYVRTPLVEKQIQAQAKTHGIPEGEVIAKVMLEPAAIKRLIEPEEVAEFALYLASDRGQSFTGAAHLMDLGWTAR